MQRELAGVRGRRSGVAALSALVVALLLVAFGSSSASADSLRAAASDVPTPTTLASSTPDVAVVLWIALGLGSLLMGLIAVRLTRPLPAPSTSA